MHQAWRAGRGKALEKRNRAQGFKSSRDLTGRARHGTTLFLIRHGILKLSLRIEQSGVQSRISTPISHLK